MIGCCHKHSDILNYNWVNGHSFCRISWIKGFVKIRIRVSHFFGASVDSVDSVVDELSETLESSDTVRWHGLKREMWTLRVLEGY